VFRSTAAAETSNGSIQTKDTENKASSDVITNDGEAEEDEEDMET